MDYAIGCTGVRMRLVFFACCIQQGIWDGYLALKGGKVFILHECF